MALITKLPTTAPPTTAPPTAASRTVPALLAAVFLALYAVFALREHARFRTTGYDLGIFGQAVRAYAEGRAPASEIRAATAPAGFTGDAYPLLGDHFHPVLALLAPLYRLAPHVETLLVAQAALVALAMYVLARTAQHHLPARKFAPVAIGTACGLGWGTQALIGFDFHEVAFAVPLLALACRAYLDGRTRAAACWAAALLLVKEDLGATAAVFGLLLVRQDRRTGLVLAAGSVLGMFLIVYGVIPAFAADGRYVYLSQASGAYGLLDGWPVKSLTVLALLAATGGLVLRSPLALLLLPTLAWRFTSANPAHWEPGLHYSAVLVPIAFAALVDALRRGVRLPIRLPVAVRLPMAGVPVALPLVTALLMLPFQPLGSLATPGFWRDGPREAAARQALELVPDGARVAASNSLAPHLTDRATVHLVADGVLDRRPAVEWIVADVREQWPAGAVERVLRRAGEQGWRVVRETEGIVVLSRQWGVGCAAPARAADTAWSCRPRQR
ncbi:DUF2079 domain-containing protein [Streptomyces sp. NBC_00572]|uniref:DUF2079 domain-containing protein n=1 Tax=Streptomyces sp. NBC_00572 TaxID=2903664 RepID=UPI00224E407E|nr:DUF2079 domain-containing protein [Streptomyces sp. NBC_00572]MCX4981529.1 DUF2079 domain-containing protein [Streptomyces sp. NBC_00572]